jgi:5'-3' exonuclease
MGIKNLNQFLRKHCPNVYEEIHISQYAFKKVAVDISLFLCKFKASYQERWLYAFIELISCLRKNEIHCIFIYDTGAVKEKEIERQTRKDNREKLEEKVFKLEEGLDHYYKTNEILPLIKIFYEKKCGVTPQKRLLSTSTNLTSINMKLVEDFIKKMKGQVLDIKPEDFELTKKLFDILDVPYFQAILEAETCASDLCKRKLVDAVLSEDTDVLAYGSPIFLSKINTRTETCIQIKYTQVLEELKFTDTQFVEFCIMCGTDYNKNIPKVGPETAFKLLQQHGSINNIKINTSLDILILNHKRSYELFRNYEEAQFKIQYCGTPNFEKLQKFIVVHNIKIPFEKLKQNFTHNIVVFEE